MIIKHEAIETYFDLLRNADSAGRITVVMEDYGQCTGFSKIQLEAMTPDERCRVVYKAVFIRFVVPLHKLSPFSGDVGPGSLDVKLQLDRDAAHVEFNLARAFGLPGVEPAAELVELSALFEHWVTLYSRHGALCGGAVRIWSADTPCAIDWSGGASALSRSSIDAISRDLVSRVAGSKVLTKWLAGIRQSLCLRGQYSHYICSAEDLLGEEEYLSLPVSSPRAEF